MTAKPPVLTTLMYSLVPIMAITAIVLFSFWMYRHHKLAYPPVLVPTQVRQDVSTLGHLKHTVSVCRWCNVSWVRINRVQTELNQS